MYNFSDVKVSYHYAKSTNASSVARQHGSLIGGIGFGLSNATMFFCYALLFWYGSNISLSY